MRRLSNGSQPSEFLQVAFGFARRAPRACFTHAGLPRSDLCSGSPGAGSLVSLLGAGHPAQLLQGPRCSQTELGLALISSKPLTKQKAQLCLLYRLPWQENSLLREAESDTPGPQREGRRASTWCPCCSRARVCFSFHRGAVPVSVDSSSPMSSAESLICFCISWNHSSLLCRLTLGASEAPCSRAAPPVLWGGHFRASQD